MHELSERINLFHTSPKDEVEKFKKREIPIILSIEDGIWLGNGMYFWDNISNAKYWQKDKDEIVKVLICIDNLLDLTDKETITECIGIIDDLRKAGVKYIQGHKSLGEIMNLLTANVDELKQYNVLKVHGYYENAKQFKIVYNEELNYSAHPTTKTKTIYSIKDDNPIIHIFEEEIV